MPDRGQRVRRLVLIGVACAFLDPCCAGNVYTSAVSGNPPASSSLFFETTSRASLALDAASHCSEFDFRAANAVCFPAAEKSPMHPRAADDCEPVRLVVSPRATARASAALASLLLRNVLNVPTTVSAAASEQEAMGRIASGAEHFAPEVWFYARRRAAEGVAGPQTRFVGAPGPVGEAGLAIGLSSLPALSAAAANATDDPTAALHAFRDPGFAASLPLVSAAARLQAARAWDAVHCDGWNVSRAGACPGGAEAALSAASSQSPSRAVYVGLASWWVAKAVCDPESGLIARHGLNLTCLFSETESAFMAAVNARLSSNETVLFHHYRPSGFRLVAPWRARPCVRVALPLQHDGSGAPLREALSTVSWLDAPSQLHASSFSLLQAMNVSSEEIEEIAQAGMELEMGNTRSGVNRTANTSGLAFAACEFAKRNRGRIAGWVATLPAILDVDPRELSSEGGEVLRILGRNFGGRFSGVTASVGFNRCTSTSWVSPTEVRCVTPPGTQTSERVSLKIGSHEVLSQVFVGRQRPVLTSVERSETGRLETAPHNVLRDEWIQVCGQGLGEGSALLMCRVGTEISSATRDEDGCARCHIPVNLPFGTSSLALSADGGKTWSSGITVFLGDDSFVDASQALPWDSIPSGVASAYFPVNATIAIILPSGAADGLNLRGDSTRAGVEVGVARAKRKLGILSQTNINVVVYDDRHVFSVPDQAERIKRLLALLSRIASEHELIAGVMSSFSSRSLLLQHPDVLAFWRSIGCLGGRCPAGSPALLDTSLCPLHMSDKGTNVQLSDAERFPLFRRVAPPDAAQARALLGAVNQVADTLKGAGVFASTEFRTAVVVEEGSSYSGLLYDDVVKYSGEFGIAVSGVFVPSASSFDTADALASLVDERLQSALADGFRAFIVVTEATVGVAWGEAIARRLDRSSIYFIVSDFTSGQLPETTALAGANGVDVGFDRSHPEIPDLEAEVAKIAVPDSVPQAVDTATLLCYAFDRWLRANDWRESTVFQMTDTTGSEAATERRSLGRGWVPFSALAPYLDTVDLSDLTTAFELSLPLSLTSFTKFTGNDPLSYSYLVFNTQPADLNQLSGSLSSSAPVVVRAAASFTTGAVHSTSVPGARIWLPSGRWLEVTVPGVLELGVVLPIPDLYDSQWQLVGLEAAVRDINNSPDIFPNTRLRLRVFGIPLSGGQAAAVEHAVSFVETLGRRYSSALPVTDGSLLGMFGCALSSLTVHCARAAERFRMPILSATSTASVLGSPVAFPYFLRTITANDRLAEAMLRLVVEFEWPRASVLFASDDTYSADFAAMLRTTAAALPVELEPVIGIPEVSTDAEISAALALIAGGRGRIVLLPVLRDFGVRVLRLACAIGMCTPSYVWIGGDSMSTEIWKNADGTTDDVILRAAQRLFGVSAASPSSAQRRAAESSIMTAGSTNPDSSVVYFEQDDVANETRKFRAIIRENRLYECGQIAPYDRGATGLGTNVSKCVSYTAAGATHATLLEYGAYDAVHVLARTIDGLYKTNQAVRPYTLAFQRELRNAKFSGASGPLRFSTLSNDRVPMQFAQRIVSGRGLSVLSVVSELGQVFTVPCPAGYGFDPIAGGCTICDQDTYKSEAANTACTPCPEVGDSLRTTTDSVQGATSVIQCLCPVGTYRPPTAGPSTVQCLSCPRGGLCTARGLVLADVQLEPGYWRGHPNSSNFATCTSQQRCPGGQVLPTGLAPTIDDAWFGGASAAEWWRFSTQCEPGYMGPRCTQCAPGYSKGGPFRGVEAPALSEYSTSLQIAPPVHDSGSVQCERCAGYGIRLLTVLGGVGVALVLLTIMVSQHASLTVPSVERLRRMSNTRVLMTYLQSTGMLLPIAPWSPLVSGIFSTSQSVGSLGPTLLALDCFFDDDAPHMSQYLWPAVGFPLGLTLGAVSLYALFHTAQLLCSRVKWSARSLYRIDLIACTAAFSIFLFYPTIIETLLRTLECRPELSMVGTVATCAAHSTVEACGVARLNSSTGANVSELRTTERWEVSEWTADGALAGVRVDSARLLFSDSRVSCQGTDFERLRLGSALLIFVLVTMIPTCICLYARRYQRLLLRGGPLDKDPAMMAAFGQKWSRQQGLGADAVGTASTRHALAVSASGRHDGLPLVFSHEHVQEARRNLRAGLDAVRRSAVDRHLKGVSRPLAVQAHRVHGPPTRAMNDESKAPEPCPDADSSQGSRHSARRTMLGAAMPLASPSSKPYRNQVSVQGGSAGEDEHSLGGNSFAMSGTASDGAGQGLGGMPGGAKGAGSWASIAGQGTGFLGGKRKRTRRSSVVLAALEAAPSGLPSAQASGRTQSVEEEARSMPSSVHNGQTEPSTKQALVEEMGQRDVEIRSLTAEVFKDTMFKALVHTPTLRNTERQARFFYRQALAYMVETANNEGRVPVLAEAAEAALQEMSMLSSTQLKLGMVMLPYKTQFVAYEIAITLRKTVLTFASVVLINSQDFVWRILVSISAILIAHRLTIAWRPFRTPHNWTARGPSATSALVVRRGERKWSTALCCRSRQTEKAESTKVAPTFGRRWSSRRNTHSTRRLALAEVGPWTAQGMRLRVLQARDTAVVWLLLLPWRWPTLRLEELSLQALQVNLLAALVANVANTTQAKQATVGPWAIVALEWLQVSVTVGLILLILLCVIADTLVAMRLLKLDWSSRRVKTSAKGHLAPAPSSATSETSSQQHPNTVKLRAIVRAKLSLLTIAGKKRELVMRALADGDAGLL